MPLRLTKDGGKTKTKAAKEQVGNVLLDSRQGSGTASLDHNVKEDAKRDKNANKAIMGYARFDLVENYNKLSFGHWNSRPLMQNQVQSLYQSFLINGVDRFNPMHALPLVLPKEWIVDGTVEKDHEKREELPILRISDKAPKDWKIKVAGGRHRTETIKKWVLKMQRDVNALEVEEKRMAKQAVEDGAAEMNDTSNTVKQRLHRLREVLQYHGQWIVTVFDANQVDTLIGIHISRNETKHVYMQSPEEGLIQRYKILEANKKTSRDVERTSMAKGSVAKQTELLSQDYVFDHMKNLVSSGTHYIHSPEMQLNRFHKVMLSGYGGLIAYATARLENRLHWCFNTVSYTLAEHRKIEAKSKNNTSFQKLKIRKEEIFEDLKQATPILESISDPLRDKLDRIFNTHLGDNTPASYRFGNDQDETWLTAFKEYSYAVVAAMDEYASEVLSADETKDLDEDVRTALLGCAGKAALVLDDSSQADYCSFPFMSYSVITTLVRNMSMIERSIFEVSSWFSPMLYMAKGHGKDWEPGSASADMIRAIMGHPNLDPIRRGDAVIEIHRSFFSMFAEYINMERQLSKINMPRRITNQQQLMATFGLVDTSNGSKGKNRKKATKAQQDRQQEDDWEDSSPLLSSEESSDADDSDEDDGSNDDDRAEHRALARKKDRRRKEDLRAEALDAQKILNGGTKFTTLQTRELYHPWTRQSKISTDATADTFRGMRLIQFHTFEWSIKSGASRARAMRLMACMVIAEQAVINAYMPKLLGDLAGGAAAIRFALEENTASYRVAFHGGKRQTTLTNVKASSQRLVNFTWPDGLEVNRHALTKAGHSFDLGFELAAHKRDVMCLGQSHQLQAIIDAVQKSPIAWEDTTGTVNVQERPPLRPEVQHALENLVKSLNANAYAQRQSSKSKKQASQNEVPSSESLVVAYWSSNMEEANDTSVVKNIKFVIPSSQEDDLCLVEEAKALECKHKLVDRTEDAGKEVVDTGDSTNRGNDNSYKPMDNGGVYDSHDVAAKSEGSEDSESEERGCDEGEVGEVDDGEDEEECADRECRDNQEINIRENQGIDEEHIPTPLHKPAKPDGSIFLDLNDDEGKQPDIIDSEILEDICMDAPPGSPSTQQPLRSFDGYDSANDDLGPQAATSDSDLDKNICVALEATNLTPKIRTAIGSATVKKTQKRGHSSSTSSNESHYKRPGSSHKPGRKRRQLDDIGRSGSSTLVQFQGTDDLASQLG